MLDEEVNGRWFYKGHFGAMFPVEKVPPKWIREASLDRFFWVEESVAINFMNGYGNSDYFGGFPDEQRIS